MNYVTTTLFKLLSMDNKEKQDIGWETLNELCVTIIILACRLNMNLDF